MKLFNQLAVLIIAASVPVFSFSISNLIPHPNDNVLHLDLNHQLRIQQLNPKSLGLDVVNQYTGYFDIAESKHLFYWFFESRNDPLNDPIVLWLNGGPGCSSTTGLFFELGPSFINETLQPQYNPYSWNSNASVIFLDQPIGVGYSYSDDPLSVNVNSTDIAGKDVYIFLELFFKKFPQFLNNKFHISGESYAGHYIPKFASEIINQKDRSFELASVLIGNGITDAIQQYKALIPMACGQGGYHPIISAEDCQHLEDIYPECKVGLDECYADPTNATVCATADSFCSKAMFGPFDKTGLNPFDIRVPCHESPDDTGDCYKPIDYVSEYLTLPSIKQVVGVDPKVIGEFSGCSSSVSRLFHSVGDKAIPHQQFITELLETKVRVLIYAGDKDYRCNWVGNYEWTNNLPYSGHYFFNKQPLKPWKITSNEVPSGEVKYYENFTFLRIYNAGHMVPHDKPRESLHMLNSWLNDELY
ncbi:Alpha/Beta hydrolase protein [Scheffersomyces coipomensis]|uniref:Alpha/Beta hydrolase protein n=1 Tax=Scheffersomyces coipomensis TaxID=1788519 RepID=UPI00315CFC26